jgi:2-polyprenyl-3-methyl-5-hydroxy-6-metoxy-1,4-benzoquinol methylase
MNLRKRVNKSYESLYNLAREETQLSWHREEIPLFLKSKLDLLNGKGKALDIGCGTGVFSVCMAQTGLQVTALDFVSKALDLCGIRAKKYGVQINLVQADIVEWKTADRFDLIFDSGCLHSISTRWQERTRYKEQILRLLAPNGSYLLIHFGKDNFFNFGIGGPVRKTPEEIKRFFSPELVLVKLDHEAREKRSLIHYWFELKQEG